MRQFLLPALALAALSGCVASKSYGNFLSAPAAAIDTKVAVKFVDRLSALYPPASTRFMLQHETSDAFGTGLVAALRSAGYEVLEFDARLAAWAEHGSGRDGASPRSEFPLSYVVDQFSELYRVTLIIDGKQALTRVYRLAANGQVDPAGYWIRKE